MKGGEWSWDPRKWSFTSKPTTDVVPTPNSVTGETQNNAQQQQEQQQTTQEDKQQPENKQQETKPAEQKTPWWKFWGGKTKRSKSKSKKTRKTLK